MGVDAVEAVEDNKCDAVAAVEGTKCGAGHDTPPTPTAPSIRQTVPGLPKIV